MAKDLPGFIAQEGAKERAQLSERKTSSMPTIMRPLPI